MDNAHRPGLDELEAYYHSYLAKAEGDDLFQALKNASERLWRTVYRIPTGFGDHRYAPGKWSIKEVFQHLLDTERIFCYRALCFARNDHTELPGFDENSYIDHAQVEKRELHELLSEHDLLRASTIALFKGFSDEMLLRGGIANGKHITVRALGWTIAGHVMHHMDVIDERYLVKD